MTQDIHVLFGFDMEPDVGSFTPFYKGVREATSPILDVFDKNNVKGTFFYTGEAAEKNPDSVREVIEKGHEVGCHSLMHETVGDPLFHIPLETSLLQEEVYNRLERATEQVKRISGVNPISFRCPRLWGSTAVVNSLEKLGYIADATYPMYFHRKQLAPYYPSRDNWLEKGDSSVLQIPNFADLVMESNDGELGRDRDQWPLFRTKGADYLIEKVEKHIVFLRERKKPIVLCFYFHPWEFIYLKKSYHFGECTIIPDEFITKNCGDYALEQFDLLIQKLQGLGANFSRIDDFAKQWKETKVIK